MFRLDKASISEAQGQCTQIPMGTAKVGLSLPDSKFLLGRPLELNSCSNILLGKRSIELRIASYSCHQGRLMITNPSESNETLGRLEIAPKKHCRALS